MSHQTIQDLYVSIRQHEASHLLKKNTYGESRIKVQQVINDFLENNHWNLKIAMYYPLSFNIDSIKFPRYGLSIACPLDRPDAYCEIVMTLDDEEVYNNEYAYTKSMYSWSELEKEIDRFLNLSELELSTPHPFSLINILDRITDYDFY